MKKKEEIYKLQKDEIINMLVSSLMVYSVPLLFILLLLSTNAYFIGIICLFLIILSLKSLLSIYHIIILTDNELHLKSVLRNKKIDISDIVKIYRKSMTARNRIFVKTKQKIVHIPVRIAKIKNLLKKIISLNPDIQYDEQFFLFKEDSKILFIFKEWHLTVALPIAFFVFLFFVSSFVDKLSIIIAFDYEAYQGGLHFSNSKLGILSNGKEFPLNGVRYLFHFLSLILIVIFNLFIVYFFEKSIYKLFKIKNEKKKK